MPYFPPSPMVDTESKMSRSTRDLLSDEEKAQLDSQYVVGYFKWYWSKYGFFNTVNQFFGTKLFNECTYQIFYNIGVAAGTFWMTWFGMPKVCERLGWAELLHWDIPYTLKN